MTNSEARDLMAQNSHDVTILDGEQANAINLVNIRNNGDVIIGDNDNQIMVLESGQKSMSMDGIEILEDKDIRILEGKSFDDRFVDGITFLSQTKIDDLLLGPKPLGIDGDNALTGHEDGRWICNNVTMNKKHLNAHRIVAYLFKYELKQLISISCLDIWVFMLKIIAVRINMLINLWKMLLEYFMVVMWDITYITCNFTIIVNDKEKLEYQIRISNLVLIS